MKKKIPQKLEETAAPYLSQRSARKKAAGDVSSAESSSVRYIDPARARKLTDEILKTHSELFRKLAQ